MQSRCFQKIFLCFDLVNSVVFQASDGLLLEVLNAQMVDFGYSVLTLCSIDGLLVCISEQPILRQ